MRTAGTMKWFNDTKGFGSITREGGEESFVHQSAFQRAGLRSLAEGDGVEFDVMPGKKTRAAENVTKWAN